MPPNAPKHFFTTLTSLKHSFTPQPPSNTLLRPQLPWNTFWRPNHTQTLLYAPDRSQAPNALGYAQPITGHSSTGGGNTLLYGQFGEHLDDLTNAIYWLTDHWLKNPPTSQLKIQWSSNRIKLLPTRNPVGHMEHCFWFSTLFYTFSWPIFRLFTCHFMRRFVGHQEDHISLVIW